LTNLDVKCRGKRSSGRQNCIAAAPHKANLSVTIKTEADETNLKDLGIHVTYRLHVGQITPVSCNHVGLKQGRWRTQMITVLSMQKSSSC